MRVCAWVRPLQLLGPPRVWLKNAPLPGLNMSRSVGDLVGKQAGVISAPHKAVQVLQPHDCTLLVASDGVSVLGVCVHVRAIPQQQQRLPMRLPFSACLTLAAAVGLDA